MSYARARRHYRVAQKEVEQSTMDGVFIPKNQKKKIIALAAILGTMLFIKGILLGLLLSSRDE